MVIRAVVSYKTARNCLTGNVLIPMQRSSVLKPFTIMAPSANPVWDIYNGELRRDVSMFPWWNHWPAAQKAPDGRCAMDADYASHSPLSHANWDSYPQTENSMTKAMLHGLIESSNRGSIAEDLASRATSWTSPAKLKLTNANSFSGGDYFGKELDPNLLRIYLQPS